MVNQLLYGASEAGCRFLLPRVGKISWTAQSEYTVTQLLVFIPDGLKQLRIILNNPVMHTSAPRLFHVLGNQSFTSNLRRFHLDTSYTNDVDLLLALGHFLVKHPQLATLDLWDIFVDPELTLHLHQLSNLEDISIGLESLEMAGSFIESLPSFSPLLTFIHVMIRLNIHDGSLSWQTLTPLFSLHMLQELEIRDSKAIVLSTDAIAQMGRAWPKLELLILGGNTTDEVEGVGTPLSVLTDFATSFPHLTHLAIHFSYDQELPSADIVWSTFRSLTTLGVGASIVPESKINMVAEFILGVCPPGVALSCYTESEGPLGIIAWLDKPELRAWRQVKDMMDIANRLRSQWDRRAASSTILGCT